MSNSINGVGGGGQNSQVQRQQQMLQQQLAASQVGQQNQPNPAAFQQGGTPQTQGVQGVGGAAGQPAATTSLSPEASQQQNEAQALQLLQQGGQQNINQAIQLLQGDTSNPQLTQDLQALQNGGNNPQDLDKVIQDLGGQPTGAQGGGQAGGGQAGQLPGQYNLSALQQNFAA